MYKVYTQGVAYSKSGTLDSPRIQEKSSITPPNYGHGMLFYTFSGKPLMAIHSHKEINGHYVLIPNLFEVNLTGDKLGVGEVYKPRPNKACVKLYMKVCFITYFLLLLKFMIIQ